MTLQRSCSGSDPRTIQPARMAWGVLQNPAVGVAPGLARHSKCILESGVNVRIVRSLAVAATALPLLAAALPAQTGWGTMNLTGVNGTSGCYSSSISPSECVYTSPYYATFSNLIPNPPATAALLPPGGGQWDIFCVDFFHNSTIGQTDNYYLTNLGDLGGSHSGWLGTYTRSNSLTKYLEAAWLAQQIETVGAGSAAALQMNGAIWQIMSGQTFYIKVGSSWYNNYSSTGISYWAGLAAANYSQVDPSSWIVVTPTNFANGGTQEYITHVTPEPATLLLLGTGLLAMIGAATMKRTVA